VEPSRKNHRLRRLARAAFTLDARSLAAYRMALGALLCCDCLLRTRDFALMFAIDGIFPPEAVRRCYADPTVWSLALLHDSTWWNGVVLGLEGMAGIMLAAGVATRLATVAAWVAVWSVVRRTGIASCGGDVWLGCQLFWSMFIPLGSAWSWDARRRAAAGQPPGPAAVCSIATAALVLQLIAVYVSAGIAKCNMSWMAGDALAHALSVHDHGTALGMAVARSGVVGNPLGWGVVALEVAAPLLLLLLPTARVRLCLIGAFVAFHAAIGLTMTVGLFVPIGMAAWLPLLPAAAWDRGTAAAVPAVTGLRRPGTWACAAALVLAIVSLLNARWWRVDLPRPVVAALNVLGLHQDWQMFGVVPGEEQWVYARAELVDGRLVDLLRSGRPCRDGRPEGGFTSLADNRWHNICWCLGLPAQAALAPEVAAGLARHWNAAHGPDAQVNSVEIRHAWQRPDAADAIERERLIASWPPRDAAGKGNLDRFLDAAAGESAAD
jgi:hypothetical protein